MSGPKASLLSVPFCSVFVNAQTSNLPGAGRRRVTGRNWRRSTRADAICETKKQTFKDKGDVMCSKAAGSLVGFISWSRR